MGFVGVPILDYPSQRPKNNKFSLPNSRIYLSSIILLVAQTEIYAQFVDISYKKGVKFTNFDEENRRPASSESGHFCKTLSRNLVHVWLTMGEKGTVCVTGGGGFVASWVIKLLLFQGYRVYGSARDPGDEKNANLKKGKTKFGNY